MRKIIRQNISPSRAKKLNDTELILEQKYIYFSSKSKNKKEGYLSTFTPIEIEYKGCRFTLFPFNSYEPIGVVVTTTGSTDFAFLVHREDVFKFAIQRFKMGDDAPRWLEDRLDHAGETYPEDFVNAYA